VVDGGNANERAVTKICDLVEENGEVLRIFVNFVEDLKE
jgi:hypothetical protein